MRHDPYGIHAEGRVLHGNAIKFYAAVVAGNGEPPVGIDLVLADDGRADTDAVAVAVQRQVIANADRWDDKAEGARDLTADAGHPTCQGAAAILGDKVD